MVMGDDDDVFVGVAENAPTNGMQDNEVVYSRRAVATTTKRVCCISGVNLTPWLIISLSIVTGKHDTVGR